MAVLTRRLLLGGTATDNTRDRSEALDAGDRMVEGAHRTGQNRESVGIENESACTDRPPTAARWAALVWLGARVCERCGTEPAEIDGHHDHGDGTVRPGDARHARLPLLRAHVAARQPVTSAPSATASLTARCPRQSGPATATRLPGPTPAARAAGPAP